MWLKSRENMAKYKLSSFIDMSFWGVVVWHGLLWYCADHMSWFDPQRNSSHSGLAECSHLEVHSSFTFFWRICWYVTFTNNAPALYTFMQLVQNRTHCHLSVRTRALYSFSGIFCIYIEYTHLQTENKICIANCQSATPYTQLNVHFKNSKGSCF